MLRMWRHRLQAPAVGVDRGSGASMAARRHRAVLLVLAFALILVLGSDHGAFAKAVQDTPSTGVPAPDIIPKPNSGHAPAEAGDRGGALQLLVLGAVVVGLVAGALHLARQARRTGSSGP